MTTAPMREAIEERIAHHHSCIITLKTQLNTLSPISVLPPEVLSEVFLHRAADWRVKKPYIPVLHDWFPVSHVCKHWRSVALGCPALWSSLNVTGPHEWMAELLVRSKSLPLSVYIMLRGSLTGSSTPQPPDESIELVLSSLGRIRVLSITSAPGCSEAPLRLLDESAPLLNSLSVSHLSSSFTSELHSHVGQLLCRPESCSLQSLELTNCPVYLPSIFSKSLTHLSIHTFGDMNLEELLEALPQFALLEELMVIGHFKRNDYAPSTLPLETQARLPHLQSIECVREESYNVAYLLNSLCTPLLSRLAVALPASGIFTGMLVELFIAMVEKVSGFADFVTLAIQTGSGPHVHEASIRAYPDACDGAAAACDSTAVWLEKHTPVLELHCDSVAFIDQMAFAAFWSRFPVGNVRSLILERALAQEGTWLELIQHIPRVTDLRILHVDDMTALPAMLSRRLSEEQRDGADDHAYRYALPLLRVLMLEGVCFPSSPPIPRVRGGQYRLRQPGGSNTPKPDFGRSLIDCLKARFESGVEIAELRILRPYGMEETIVDKLREVVRSVKWDGISGGSSDAYRPGDPMIRVVYNEPLDLSHDYDDDTYNGWPSDEDEY